MVLDARSQVNNGVTSKVAIVRRLTLARIGPLSAWAIHRYLTLGLPKFSHSRVDVRGALA